MIRYSIGEQIAHRRRQLGISQMELSRKTGVHQVTISDIEQGYREPNLSTIERLMDPLGLELRIVEVTHAA